MIFITLRRAQITSAEQMDDNVKFDSNALLEETDLAEDTGSFQEKLRSVTVGQCETETVDVSMLDKTSKIENMLKPKRPLTNLWDFGNF